MGATEGASNMVHTSVSGRRGGVYRVYLISRNYASEIENNLKELK